MMLSYSLPIPFEILRRTSERGRLMFAIKIKSKTSKIKQQFRFQIKKKLEVRVGFSFGSCWVLVGFSLLAVFENPS
jgi:hypothetical protein